MGLEQTLHEPLDGIKLRVDLLLDAIDLRVDLRVDLLSDAVDVDLDVLPHAVGHAHGDVLGASDVDLARSHELAREGLLDEALLPLSSPSVGLEDLWWWEPLRVRVSVEC